MINRDEMVNRDGIKIEGHRGTWYVINEMDVYNDATKKEDKRLYLLEHEVYGEDAPHLIVDKDLNIILDDVWNGFDDYWEFIGNK